MDYLGEEYLENGNWYVLARFQATAEGVRAAEMTAERMATVGFVVVAVGQSQSELDVGASVIQSGIGIGLAGLTGFGFLRAKRKAATFMVKFGLADPSLLPPA